jgi:hypothetical protein
VDEDGYDRLVTHHQQHHHQHHQLQPTILLPSSINHIVTFINQLSHLLATDTFFLLPVTAPIVPGPKSTFQGALPY